MTSSCGSKKGQPSNRGTKKKSPVFWPRVGDKLGDLLADILEEWRSRYKEKEGYVDSWPMRFYGVFVGMATVSGIIVVRDIADGQADPCTYDLFFGWQDLAIITYWLVLALAFCCIATYSLKKLNPLGLFIFAPLVWVAVVRIASRGVS